jgi:hypothetical protein
MFQWVEYVETHGSGRKKRTTYSYEMEWDTDYWDSSEFHTPAGHTNPKPALEGEDFFAPDARFGPYRFDNVDVVDQALYDSDDPDTPGSLGNWPVEVSQLPGLPSALRDKGWYELEAGLYYKGRKDSPEPQLGDLRASFYALKNDYTLSMIGAQVGDHLESWHASNGDKILLAEGGTRSADVIVKDAVVAQAGLTSLLRIVGLIGAVIGAAGMGRWLGSFLSVVPVVGSLVSLSLAVAGGLFGLMMGLTTIVIGWLAARPWIAALLLIAIGSTLTWFIQQRRKADRATRVSKRAADLGALARQRAAERAAMPTPPPGAPALATAGAPLAAAAMAPPPKAPVAARAAGSSAGPAARPAPPSAPPPPPPADDSKELPPLEWTPGLIATKPAAVRPKAELPPPAPVDDMGAIPFDTSGLRPPAPKPAPSPAVRPPAPPPDALAGFGGVPPRERAQPLFDTVEPRVPSAPLFDTVEPRAAAAPMFDLVEARTPPAPMFDQMPGFADHADGFDIIDTPPPALTAPPTPAPAPKPVAVAPAPQPVAASNAPVAPAAAAPIRIALGSRGEYTINKIVRRPPDGPEQVVCFELTRAGKPVKRGTQDEVKQALKELLAGG